MSAWQKTGSFVNVAALAGLLHNTNVIGATYYVFRVDKIGQTSFFTGQKNVFLGMDLLTKMMNLCSMMNAFYQVSVFVNIRTAATLHTSDN